MYIHSAFIDEDCALSSRNMFRTLITFIQLQSSVGTGGTILAQGVVTIAN